MKLAIAFAVVSWLSFNGFLLWRFGVVAGAIDSLRFHFRPPEITRDTLQPR